MRMTTILMLIYLYCAIFSADTIVSDEEIYFYFETYIDRCGNDVMTMTVKESNKVQTSS